MLFLKKGEKVLDASYDLDRFINKIYNFAKNSNSISIDNKTIIVKDEMSFKKIALAICVASRIKNINRQIIVASTIINALDDYSVNYWYLKVVEAYQRKKITGTYRVLSALKVMLGYG